MIEFSQVWKVNHCICPVKNKAFRSIRLSLLTCRRDHVQKPCKPVFLYHYYYTEVTKWNFLESKPERKQT